MSTPAESMQRLSALARELGELSSALADVNRKLDPVENDYTQFVDDFEIGLWRRHEDEGAKLPSEKLRLKLAHKAMDPALYGRYVGLTKSRERLMKRISDLRVEVDAERSILSALKTEMEAVR